MRTIFKRGLVASMVLALFASQSQAATSNVPQNLGFGLDKLVESRALVKADASRAIYDGYATEQAANYATLAIVDETTDRVLVDIVPTGKIGIDALGGVLQTAAPSFTVTGVDAKYRHTGLIEGFVSVDDAAALATTPGVRSVFLALKPYTRAHIGPIQSPSVVPGDHLNKVGTAFDAGVIQHRVDRISQVYNPLAPVNYDGQGISIGLMSDSYDTRAAAPHASAGVASFDLPGAPTNPWNTQPVVVLEDSPGGTDEGRGMTEIAYKMAPRARLAFATANSGEVGFANNIRALAALPGYEKAPGVQQGFKADVIADDVGYFDEPWYEDGVIGNAIDDVAAAGVSYFSSAANDIGINGYESTLRIIPNGTGVTAAAGNVALANTNIDLTGVPANLYAGGFHNFNPSGTDVAQLVNFVGTQIVIMQWDDPYDSSPLVLDEPPVFSSVGAIDNVTTSVTFGAPEGLPVFTTGQAYVINEVATGGNFDAIVNIFDSSNNLVLSQDTGTDELVNFFPQTTEQYHITVNRFSTTTGTFSITVNTAPGAPGVTTDLNLLAFRADTGAYLGTRSLTAPNIPTNRPIELGQFGPPSGQTQMQFVIARANTPNAPQLPTRVRWLIPGNGAANIGPAEYFKYNTVTTGGHATARGCNGTAAYSVFRPNQPESFTSPGPATIMFDKDSKRLAAPEVRLQPRVAAADAANTSFFSGDSTSDLDTNPNFSGTSAAAPHAAAVAGLVLQSRGGSGSVSPAQMTSILQASAFPHDLDPAFASGTAATTDGGNVTITIESDNEANLATGQNDPSSFQIRYSGPGSLASLVFNPAGTATAGGHTTGGNNGQQDDVGSIPPTVSYFENSFPGLTFLPGTKAFTLGPLTGLTAADIVQPSITPSVVGFSNLAPAPGNGTTHYRTMAIGFPNANFTTGAVVRFTVGRGAQHSSAVGTVATPTNGLVTNNPQADLFGGGVQIPSGIVITDGMTFSGTTTAGGVFTGTIKNNIGAGYSILDGYGFIDASRATGTLSGVGVAAPSSGYPGASTLLKVTVSPGVAPSSTGLAVSANLSGIGGSASQQLYDDGTHGDETAGDQVFSLSTTIGAAAAGNKVLPVVISDDQARNGNTQINYTVLSPTALSASASATPSAVVAGGMTHLSVTIVPGNNPVSSGVQVKANLTAIGGSATQAFADDGDGLTFSFDATVDANSTAGIKLMPAVATDAQGRSADATLAVNVLASGAPYATGIAVSALPGDTALLQAVATPGSNPASTGLVVTVDLTQIGGAAPQQFYDDGTHGDLVAGDNVFSFEATIAPGTPIGSTLSLPITVSDAQLRSGGGSITLKTQSDRVFADGFDGP